MASVTSHTSPHSSLYDFDSTGDDEPWQYLDYSSGASAPGSVGFLPSPASGSLNGYAIVGHPRSTPPQASVSPLSLVEMDQTMFLPAGSTFPGQNDQFTNNPIAASSGGPSFFTPQQYLFSGTERELTQQELNDMAPFMTDFQADLFSSVEDHSTSSVAQADNFTTQPLFPQDPMAIAPWNAESPNAINAQMMSFEELISSPHVSNSAPSTSSISSPQKSPPVKAETTSSSPSSLRLKSPLTIRKVKDGKIQKRKAELSGKFVIMTPNSINAQAGRPNPFECFDAMRATQRGRKGPLANETKRNALQVVCWQFQDFIPVLFPGFIRSHLRKEEMVKFLKDNVDGFRVGGVEQPCEVELFSGPRFSAVLSVKAKFFAAKTCDVLQHWHMNTDQGRANLQSSGSAPIGLEFNTVAQRDDLRKRVKAYIQDIINEPFFAEQITDSFRSTQLPTKILRIVQTYAKQSNSHLVKRALSIYAMHYIMTRHLCLTNKSILALQSSGLVPQNTPWVTPRVLARQMKSLIDDLIMREMQHIFEMFSKSLKPKHRREWAPCTAAFLVLCLFMEAVETTAENFALSQNEINRRNTSPPEYTKNFALTICKELENMPFKQFAFQFHNIYQTHARDANTKSFNPLFDDSFMEQGELDGPAVEMVRSMRELLHGEDWQDLQFLADDEIILNRGEHFHPIDSSFLYTGRLVAKFLLSFTNENIIFGGQI
ncbi:hypothetical protein EsDP_00004229 [Epichloe bromicola]|uniref:Mating-type protein MAT1-1-1 n=1 Tax=Epichloe bromicola TaxID=79588 RepID=A0ABQ0CRH9_9HYPO